MNNNTQAIHHVKEFSERLKMPAHLRTGRPEPAATPARPPAKRAKARVVAMPKADQI